LALVSAGGGLAMARALAATNTLTALGRTGSWNAIV